MLNRPQASSQRARRQLGIMVDGESQVNTEAKWYDVLLDSQKVGDMACRVWTCRLKKNIGYTLVSHHCAPGDHVEVVVGGEWIMYPPDTAIEDKKYDGKKDYPPGCERASDSRIVSVE